MTRPRRPGFISQTLDTKPSIGQESLNPERLPLTKWFECDIPDEGVKYIASMIEKIPKEDRLYFNEFRRIDEEPYVFSSSPTHYSVGDFVFIGKHLKFGDCCSPNVPDRGGRKF